MSDSEPTAPERISIEVDSLQHQNPIPCATRMGPLLVSSITPPYNPGTREMPDTIEEQVENLFIHVGQMLEEAGAGWEHMAKMTFYVADPNESRAALNGPWEKLFPDPASRPSRHNLKVPSGGKMLISTTFMAWIPEKA